MIDLQRASDQVAAVVARVSDDQLDDPTPCTGTSVRVMVNHLLGLTVAFRDAAGKVEGPTTSTPPGPITAPCRTTGVSSCVRSSTSSRRCGASRRHGRA